MLINKHNLYTLYLLFPYLNLLVCIAYIEYHINFTMHMERRSFNLNISAPLFFYVSNNYLFYQIKDRTYMAIVPYVFICNIVPLSRDIFNLPNLPIYCFRNSLMFFFKTEMGINLALVYKLNIPNIF